jgi:hypothetical protein
LIGEHAFAEVRDVLDRDGVTLPIWDDLLICRSFVAMVVRLRYFAPGARGFFFPAIDDWPEVDRWLSASGLDLPEPLQTNRLPMLLVAAARAAAICPPRCRCCPTALPFGCSDPDLPRAIAAAQALTTSSDAGGRGPVGLPLVRMRGPRPMATQLRARLSSAVWLPCAKAPGCADAEAGLRACAMGSLSWGAWLLRRLLLLPGVDDIGFCPAGADARSAGPLHDAAGLESTTSGTGRGGWRRRGHGTGPGAVRAGHRPPSAPSSRAASRGAALSGRGAAARATPDRPATRAPAAVERAIANSARPPPRHSWPTCLPPSGSWTRTAPPSSRP